MSRLDGGGRLRGGVTLCGGDLLLNKKAATDSGDLLVLVGIVGDSVVGRF